MILYRYFASHWLETLESGELMVSRVSKFNDPFELMYRVGGTMTREKARKRVLERQKSPELRKKLLAAAPHISSRKLLRKFLRDSLSDATAAYMEEYGRMCEEHLQERLSRADEHMRLICFSAESDRSAEILMWSHYAAKHSGVRIGFEFPHLGKGGIKIEEIKYSDQRIEVDFTNDPLGDAVQRAIFESTVVKAKAWSYEREYRLFTHPELCKRRSVDGRTLEFIPFRKEWVRFVDFGVNYPLENLREAVDRVSIRYPHVACRKARHHRSDFALDYPEITSTSRRPLRIAEN